MYKVRALQRLLRRLGVNGSYIGFDYTIYGTGLVVRDRFKLVYITKDLYPDIAKKYNTSVSCVERNIRTVVEVIWYQGDKELLNDISGKELLKKPKNKEFIELLADFIRDYQESNKPEQEDAGSRNETPDC